jgi:hypothetical protein
VRDYSVQVKSIVRVSVCVPSAARRGELDARRKHVVHALPGVDLGAAADSIDGGGEHAQRIEQHLVLAGAHQSGGN